MRKRYPRQPQQGNIRIPYKERQSYIAPGGLYLFLSSLSKREGVYTCTRLLGSGVKPQYDDHLVNRVRFDLEEETEAINGMGSVDTTRVCNFNNSTHL